MALDELKEAFKQGANEAAELPDLSADEIFAKMDELEELLDSRLDTLMVPVYESEGLPADYFTTLDLGAKLTDFKSREDKLGRDGVVERALGFFGAGDDVEKSVAGPTPGLIS